LVIVGLAACSPDSLMEVGAKDAGAGGAPVDAAVMKTLCTGVPPASPQLTGVANTVVIPSSDYAYAAPQLTLPTGTPVYSADGIWQSLTVVASPGTTSDPGNNWLGVGVPFASCIDASAYTGVRFTITGDLGTCALSFVAAPAEQSAVANGGACTDPNCWSPASPTFGVGTTTARFIDLNGGSPPGPVDPSRLMTIQWQLNVPTDGVTAPCVANFTVSDISFVTM
jgi:hypothetical protein